ncbi:hypothetical protein [Streptomyces canus]|uniref:hypothetical protein n=1 Tax=Streptomyces canus TaxID=58343 RepID=UPI000372BAC8|nr:hypothetical protein [Streptomyces canus]
MTIGEQISRLPPLLRGLLTQSGLAPTGRAGVRLAAGIGVSVGRDTLLRMIRGLPEPEIGEVEVLEVDDFAFGKVRCLAELLAKTTTTASSGHEPLRSTGARIGS